jgi:hypothetical protein
MEEGFMAKKPMNKFLKFILWTGGIVLGLFVFLLVAAAIIIPIKFPPEKLKAIATEQLTRVLKHKVTIGSVHFNILSGFGIQDLVVANRPGWAQSPLLQAADISISYHLLPLLWGQVSLGEIKLNQPQILVEKRGPGNFNFSDMTGSSPATSASAAAPAHTKPKAKAKAKKKRRAEFISPEEAPVQTSFFADSAWAGTVSSSSTASKIIQQLSVDSINIAHAHLEYLDESVSPAQKSVANDLNVKVKNISLEGGKTTYSIDTPLAYNKLTYQFSVAGSLRYFYASQSIKELALKGEVNDLGFNLSGDALNLASNFSPTMDGEASLNMLKFVGLVPSSMYQMPQGLSLTGPAKVDFHLAGSRDSGLELSGTADGSELVIQYKDLFVKTDKTACKIDFKTVNNLNRGVYDVPSFKVVYGDWNVTGSFHYSTSAPWSCKIHSDALPFKGLPGMLPKMKNTTVDGTGAVDLSIVSSTGKTLPFLVNGQILLKGVGITLPSEPYLQNMTGPIYCANNVIRIPSITSKSFDGDVVMGVTLNGPAQTYSYAFRLTNVDAPKAIDGSIDAYVTTKDYSQYKDKLSGKMNLAYAGYGKGFSGDAMMASQVGQGNYSLTDTKLKGLSAIKTVNSLFKDKSDEIHFDNTTGNLAMRKKVFSYTSSNTGKIGSVAVVGGIDVLKMAYTPDMQVKCNVKKDLVDTDAVLGVLPQALRGFAKVDYLADDNGNIPVDVKFTGPVSENHYSWDTTRIGNNVKKHLGSIVQQGLQSPAAQNTIQDLGNKLKGLFGH